MNSEVDNISLKVLLVDDSELCVKALSSILTLSGHRVTSAKDGINALREIENNVFDLILIDINLPLLNGYEVTKIIRSKEQKNSKIIIIGITSNLVDDQMQLAKHVGMNAIISKPINIDKLNQLVVNLNTTSAVPC